MVWVSALVWPWVWACTADPGDGSLVFIDDLTTDEFWILQGDHICSHDAEPTGWTFSLQRDNDLKRISNVKSAVTCTPFT